MNMNTNSTIQNTARLGVCLLIGAAAFAACGQVKEAAGQQQPSGRAGRVDHRSRPWRSIGRRRSSWHRTTRWRLRPAVYLSAADGHIATMKPTVYVSAADARIATMEPTVYLSAADARIGESFGYVSPEALDKQAQLEGRGSPHAVGQRGLTSTAGDRGPEPASHRG